jgi:hypothetical protein
VTAHFTCTDGGAGIASCPADQLLSIDGPDQLVTGTVTDTLGNQATASALANIDATSRCVGGGTCVANLRARWIRTGRQPS